MSELRHRLEQMLERLSPRERLLVGGALSVAVLVVLRLVATTLGVTARGAVTLLEAITEFLRARQLLLVRFAAAPMASSTPIA